MEFEPKTPEFEIDNDGSAKPDTESTDLIEVDADESSTSICNEETVTPEPMQEIYVDEEPTPIIYIDEDLDDQESSLSPPLIEIDEEDDNEVCDESTSSTPDYQVSPPSTPPSYDRCKTCKQILQDLPTFNRNGFTEEYGEGKDHFKKI